MRKNLKWPPIIKRGAEIVREYDTHVTLRQLFYRLVSEQLIPNTKGAYSRLSALTADGRREDEFPALSDLTRGIEIVQSFDSPKEAVEWAAQTYRNDRTEGQDIVPVLITEKATLTAQLWAWFARPYGIAIAPLRGFSSESFEREILDSLDPARRYRALYVGDFDPSGEDIERNAQRFLGDSFDRWTKVTVRPEHVAAYGLVENEIDPLEKNDSRNEGFLARHGKLVQVEVEALAPTDLRALIQASLDETWDYDAYDDVLEREIEEAKVVKEVADGM